MRITDYESTSFFWESLLVHQKRVAQSYCGTDSNLIVIIVLDSCTKTVSRTDSKPVASEDNRLCDYQCLLDTFLIGLVV